MTTRDRVEEWLKTAPTELHLSAVSAEEITANDSEVGKITPLIIRGGYDITIRMTAETWDEED